MGHLTNAKAKSYCYDLAKFLIRVAIMAAIYFSLCGHCYLNFME